MVAYRFEDSRSGDCVARHLAGFGGLLQVDGYAAYNRLAKGAGTNDGVTLAACFAHVRRRFNEQHVNESSHLATQTITTMAALWKVEEDIRGKDPATRVKVRQEKSAAIVARLFELWEADLPRLSGKSKHAEAIRYAISRRAALERFLSDGRVEIGGVDDWRGDRRTRGFTVSGCFRCCWCRSSHHSSVSSRRSSNRACRFVG
jgi:transposase